MSPKPKRTKIDFKKAMKRILEMPIKHPHAELMSALNKVDLDSEDTKKNETQMTDAQGRDILYLQIKEKKK